MHLQHYYSVLGISTSSSIEDIKKAYRKKTRENHPDRGGDETVMKEINTAYEELLKIAKQCLHTRDFYRSAQSDQSSANYKCRTCGADSHYPQCIDCWIKIKREEKRQRIKTIRSFMRCLYCAKTLSHRPLVTLFCDLECSKNYYAKRGKRKHKEPCLHNGKCLDEEDTYRLEKIEIEKIINLKYKERISIFTRLIGKKKAIWFDSEVQKRFT